jgi:hypothetical protein
MLPAGHLRKSAFICGSSLLVGAFAALREILGIRVLLPLGLSDTFNRKTLDIRRRLLL